jgi:3-oxoacid CoA-transferase subunit A
LLQRFIMRNKVVDIKTAIDQVKKDSTVMLGGFSEVGCPLHLLYELASRPEINGLTLVAEDMSSSGLPFVQGPQALLDNGQLRKIIVSFLGAHKPAEQAIAEGRLALEFVPQGTLAERIRAGGAGLGGFFTPTGAGTEAAEGKETRMIDGREYVFEKPLRSDVSLIKAYKADRYGNAVFKLTANNFNTCMATAGKIVILEVEKLVEPGEIQPDAVQLPGVFVDYIVVEEGAMF